MICFPLRMSLALGYQWQEQDVVSFPSEYQTMLTQGNQLPKASGGACSSGCAVELGQAGMGAQSSAVGAWAQCPNPAHAQALRHRTQPTTGLCLCRAPLRGLPTAVLCFEPNQGRLE